MNIDELQAGQELDVLVAINVMGFHDMRNAGGSDLAYFYSSIPFYSDDVALAWQVENKIKERCLIEPYILALAEIINVDAGMDIGVFISAIEVCSWTGEGYKALWHFAHAIPEQKCRAALKAVLNES